MKRTCALVAVVMYLPGPALAKEPRTGTAHGPVADARSRGVTEETILVTPKASMISKYEGAGSASLEGEVAAELSFKGRNYQSAADVLPGVVHDAQSRQVGDSQFAVNGGQSTEVAGFVDGVDTSHMRFNGSLRTFLPTTSLEELRIDSAGFGAEHGRVVSAVTHAAVKSGTNRYRGQLLYVPQSPLWRAGYRELRIPRQHELVHSFEANAGGPISRDKAWFFAAYAEQDTNEIDQTRDGSTEAVGLRSEVSVLKLNFRPSARHDLTVLGIDSPVAKVQLNRASGDRFTPCACNLEGEIASLTWGHSISTSLFLEAKLASQTNHTFRKALRRRDTDPDANPDSPLGNNFRYQDLRNNMRYNSIAQGAGTGFVSIPRDQVNVSSSVFRGLHEIKLGLDFQHIEMETFNEIGNVYYGLGYDENAVGGFHTPQFLRIYDRAQVATTKSGVYSIYAQDRMTPGERWSLTIGLRLDDQTQDNDVGEETASWRKVSPRLAAAYDAHGNGRLLVKATAGRYYQAHPQDLASAVFRVLPDGRNAYDELNWNPLTQRYDLFNRRQDPPGANPIREVDPYYKDEVSFGVEWQFSEFWAFRALGTWWKIGDAFWTTTQYDENGIPFLDLRNWDGGFRDYRGLRWEVSRALRQGWTVRVNHTWAENRGNTFGAGENVVLYDDDLFEGLGGVEVGTGATDATIVHREGRGNFDRTHILNVVGLKQISIGAHTIRVGGSFSFRSGERWGLRANTTLVHPDSGKTIRTTSYRQPRDAEQLEDTFVVNLTGTWTFPLGPRFNARVGIEVTNVTDEQAIIGVNRANGQPLPGVAAFQAPREVRGQVGITF